MTSMGIAVWPNKRTNRMEELNQKTKNKREARNAQYAVSNTTLFPIPPHYHQYTDEIRVGRDIRARLPQARKEKHRNLAARLIDQALARNGGLGSQGAPAAAGAQANARRRSGPCMARRRRPGRRPARRPDGGCASSSSSSSSTTGRCRLR